MASAARDLRYNSRNAVYGDLAYDLDRELRERELGHAGELPRTREVTVPAAKPKVRSVSHVQVREAQRVSALSVVGFAAAAVLALLVLMSYIQLTALSAETVELKQQLSALEKENVTLTAQHERMFDLDAVKEAAAAAGMTKPRCDLPAGGAGHPQPRADVPEPRDLRGGGIFRLRAAL